MKRSRIFKSILVDNGLSQPLTASTLSLISYDGTYLYFNYLGDELKASLDTTAPITITTDTATIVIYPLVIPHLGGVDTYILQLQVLDEDGYDITALCTYTSNGTGIATVSSAGLIRTVASGTTTVDIVAPSSPTVSGVTSLSIGLVVRTLTITPTTLTIVTGTTYNTSAITMTNQSGLTVTGATASGITYLSNTPSVATISSPYGGVITAVHSGSTNVTIAYLHTDGVVLGTLPVTVIGLP